MDVSASGSNAAIRSDFHEAPAHLLARYLATRARSLALAAPLSEEDAMVQSMEDASPAKWHLAHTSWFFERFVLAALAGHAPFDARWDFLFNSYYQGAGPMHARPRRGLLSRPSLAQVIDYRHAVDQQLSRQLRAGTLGEAECRIVELGIQHEQQHQELLLTDIKHALWCNPLAPAYREDLPRQHGIATPLRWQSRDETIVAIGAPPWPGHPGFAYDNESPRHRVLVAAHALAERPVSNAEYQQFIDAGGYRTPALWLSDGWAWLQADGVHLPLYWHAERDEEFTLAGWRTRDPHAPVCHLNYYEADAFARWAGARLPGEAEWELAATSTAVTGNLLESGHLHPQPLATGTGMQQLFGDAWEWTHSAYSAYPGFQPWPGTLGEYNGKFMSGQQVLRGGSCATPQHHVRASYRNFFPPTARWQFSGLRLAKDR